MKRDVLCGGFFFLSFVVHQSVRSIRYRNGNSWPPVSHLLNDARWPLTSDRDVNTSFTH